MSLTTNIRVHARQLAFKPNLQIIRRSRRPLLRGLEQARRSALAHHVPRIAPMGARVLINGTRYKSKLSTPANPSVLGQANDLMSVDTEDHLLLTRQLDDEFQLLVGRMHQLDRHIALDLRNFSAVEIATQEIEAQHVESSN